MQPIIICKKFRDSNPSIGEAVCAPSTCSIKKGRQAQASFTLAQRSMLECLAGFFHKQSKSYSKHSSYLRGDPFDKPHAACNKERGHQCKRQPT